MLFLGNKRLETGFLPNNVLKYLFFSLMSKKRGNLYLKTPTRMFG
jgi:hypothetical protein